MKDFEEIIEEVKTYETANLVGGLEKNPDEQAIGSDYERVNLWNETDIRNDIIKANALLIASVVCGRYDLMDVKLWVPIFIGCMCYSFYKLGVFKGRNED